MSFKEQLKSEILPRAVQHYNGGLDINAAIVKTAEEFHLNLDQTDRLLETMNTARVIAHYEKNAEDRTSNCDIAEKDIVHKMLFQDKAPAEEKKASTDATFSEVDYFTYYSPETNYRKRGLSKAASVEEPRPKSTDGFTRNQLLDQLSDYGKKFTDQRKFAEDQEGMARELLASSVTKLASDLSKGYDPEERYALFKMACRTAYPDAFAQVEAAVSKDIVQAAVPYLKKIARLNVLDTSSIDKELSAAKEIQDGIAVIDRICKIAEAFRKREAKVIAALRKEAMPSPVPLPPGGGSGGRGRRRKQDNNDTSNNPDPWLGGGGTAVGSAVGSGLKAMIPPVSPGVKAVSDYLQGGALTPESISEAITPKKTKKTTLRDYIDNVRRSDLISELYNDDPIISEAEPDAVMDAYRTLVQSAPEASLNKEIVRAVLRQSVNSVAVSPFDAKQWAELDSTLLKNKTLSSDKKVYA